MVHEVLPPPSQLPPTTPVVEVPHTPEQPAPPPLLNRSIVRATAIVALAAAGASMAACEQKHTAQPQEGAYSATTTTQTGQAVALSQLKDEVTGYKPDIAKARTLEPTIIGSNAGMRTPVQQAVDAAVAKGVLKTATNTTGLQPPFTKPQLNGITNTSLRAQTANAVYVFGADEAISRLNIHSDGDYMPAKARTDITSNMPAGAEKQRDNALKAVDVTYASNLITESAGDEAVARKGLQQIKTPSVRADAQRLVDFKDATDVLDKMSFDGITAGEAQADLANVATASIRTKALNAVKDYGRGNDSAANDVQYDLSNKESDLDATLSSSETALSDDVRKANTYKTGLDTTIYANVQRADEALGREYAAESGLQPRAAGPIKPVTNLGETLDLTQVKGKHELQNSYKLVAPLGERAEQPDTYRQFGEVYIKDRKLTLGLQAGGGMNATLARQINEAYSQVLPLMEAGFASGEVVAVRLIAGGSFDPEFIPGTREVYLKLGNDDSVTMDRLVSAWRHELLHGISRNIMRDEGVSKKDQQRFASACNDLKATMYDDFENDLKYHPKIIDGLYAAIHPKHRAIIDELAKAVDDGTLLAALKEPAAITKTDTIAINECRDVSNSTSLLQTLQSNAGVNATSEDLKYLYDSPAFTAFAKDWQGLMDYMSAYKKVINESAYVTNDDLEGEYMGHSEENSAEVFASLLDAALTYPAAFEKNLKAADPDVRKATLEMLSACVHFMARHPSLKPYATQLQKRYRLAA